MRRFQMRVIFQNFPNHVMIFFGVFFANFILLFGMILQPMLAHYQNTIPDVYKRQLYAICLQISRHISQKCS